MMMNPVIEPEKRKEDGKENRIDQHRNKSSEKNKGKAPVIWTDPNADKLFDKLMMNYPRYSPRVGPALDKELRKRPINLVFKYSTSSLEVGSSSGSNSGESHKSRGVGHVVSEPVMGSLGGFHKSRWVNIEEMLLSLKDSPRMQMEAICALYRQGRNTHEPATIMLSYPYFEKLKRLAVFLTAGNVHGPCVKTSEELEETFKGGTDFCSGLVSTYSSELYHIYYRGLDLYFR